VIISHIFYFFNIFNNKYMDKQFKKAYFFFDLAKIIQNIKGDSDFEYT